ncbi:T9SS C-terminal target domain-containing protein [Marinilabiliaceae bacterium JC017]|nr:T9SS C-terminal target domain-containing protein [Marinilabiliaceae bacterium JC017]
METLLIIALSFFAISASFGQVTFEHTYQVGEEFNSHNAFVVNDILYYYSNDKNNVYLYNEQHELIKTITLENTASLQKILIPSDKLFNTDSKIEFIAYFFSESTQDNLRLYNEDGLMIKDLGKCSKAYYIKAPDNTYKLFTYSEGTNTINVYGLEGSLTSIQEEILKKSIQAYPNPAKNYINIPINSKTNEKTTLTITNQNGSVIKQKEVEPNETVIKVNTSEYNKGVYFYNHQTNSGKFIVQ